MIASKVFTSYGEVLTTEPDSNPMACISGDEISRVEVNVPSGTLCDICGELITDQSARDDGPVKRRRRAK